MSGCVAVAFWWKCDTRRLLVELRHAPLCGTKVAQPPLSDGRHRVDARAGCRSEAHREHTEQRLAALKASGITLALDDFGTGYASLSYLRRLPVDIVKIDRSFTDGIDSATADLVLLKGIIDLGNALGLNLVAEGIQAQAQHEIVRGLGCHSAQGFYFGYAAAEALRELADNHRSEALSSSR